MTDTPPSSVTEAVSCGSGLDDSVMSLSFSSMSTSITSLTRQSMSARYCNDTGKNSLNCNWIQGALNIYYDENVSMIKPRLAGAGLKQCFFSVNSLGGSSPLPPENIVAGNELIWTRLLFFYSSFYRVDPLLYSVTSSHSIDGFSSTCLMSFYRNKLAFFRKFKWKSDLHVWMKKIDLKYPISEQAIKNEK